MKARKKRGKAPLKVRIAKAMRKYLVYEAGWTVDENARYVCPDCEFDMPTYVGDEPKYCMHCGQRLKKKKPVTDAALDTLWNAWEKGLEVYVGASYEEKLRAVAKGHWLETRKDES